MVLKKVKHHEHAAALTTEGGRERPQQKNLLFVVRGGGGQKRRAAARLPCDFLVAMGSMLLFSVSSFFFGLRRAVHEEHLRPRKFSRSLADQWALQEYVGRSGYFLDVGAFGRHSFSNTRLLEDHGWAGICADPMPRGFETRACGYVPRPIGRVTGERVRPKSGGCMAADTAAARSDNASRGGVEYPACTKWQTTTMGVADLLDMVEAPSIIDLMSISARGSVLPILEGFPWDRFCARLWAAELGSAEEARSEAKAARLHLRQNGCHMVSQGTDLWATCPCGRVDLEREVPAAERPAASLRTKGGAKRSTPLMMPHSEKERPV